MMQTPTKEEWENFIFNGDANGIYRHCSNSILRRICPTDGAPPYAYCGGCSGGFTESAFLGYFTRESTKPPTKWKLVEVVDGPNRYTSIVESK